MSFSGNLLQLDLLSAFSHQQLKTIEDVLLSSSINQAPSFNNFQSHSFVCNTNNNTTPPTWTKAETTSSTADFDQLDQVTSTTTMNNLPKIQNPATGGNVTAVGGGGGSVVGSGGAPAPGANNQFAEYLAMQQQAQQQHQQHTQQQNQALAAAGAQTQSAAGHFLGNRPFESQLLHQAAARGTVAAAAATGALKPMAGGPPVPPLAISSSQVPPPAAMHLTHSAAPVGPAMIGHQKQPLALTSNVGRFPPAPVQVQAAPPAQTVQGPQSLVKEQVPIVPAPPQLISSGIEQAPAAGNLQTTTVKLSYQQREVVVAAPPGGNTQGATIQPVNQPPPVIKVGGAGPTLSKVAAVNPNPVLPSLHPLPQSGAAVGATSPPPLVLREEGIKPQPQAGPATATNPNLKSDLPSDQKKQEAPGKAAVLSSPTRAASGPTVPQPPVTGGSGTSASPINNNNNNNNNNVNKSPVKPVIPATVTTPSKTSMKLATVTTPRIKQTARKNQSALQQQRSPTNLASISPAKSNSSSPSSSSSPATPSASPATVATTPVKSSPVVATNVSPVGKSSGGGGGIEKISPKATLIATQSVVVDKPVAPAASVATPVRTPAVTKKREAKVKDPPVTASEKAEETPGSSSGKTKRNRIRTVPYQIPTPEITLAQKLSIAEAAAASVDSSPVASTSSASAAGAGSKRSLLANGRGGGERSGGSSSVDSGGEDKLTLFYKNEFVAVRNAEDGFFLCQVLQNVYKSSPKIRIRWLSEVAQRPGVYVPDFYDVTDLECILTNVDLEKEKGEFTLPGEEQTRIGNILKKAMGLLEVSEITEDNPDGLDLSIYKDEAQLDRKEEKKNKARTKTKKAGKVATAAKSRKSEEDEEEEDEEEEDDDFYDGESSEAEAPKSKAAKKATAPGKAQGTKRASNGVARGGKTLPVAASSSAAASTAPAPETPTRVSKRARAIQSPNYREDDDDDMPLLKASGSSVASAAPTAVVLSTKVPQIKIAEKTVAPVVVAAAAKTPVGKKKAVEVKKDATPVVAATPKATPPSAKGKAATPAKSTAKGKAAAAVLVPVKEDVPKVVEKATTKKAPGKRKAEKEEEKKTEMISPPPAAKKTKAVAAPALVATPTAAAKKGTAGASKGVAALVAKPEESLAALKAKVESTKKAGKAVAAVATSPPAKKQTSPGSGKGRGRGKKQ